MQTLLGGPRSTFTEAEVLATLALTNGTKVRHGVTLFSSTDTALAASAGVTVDMEDAEVTWAYRPPDDVTGVTNEAAEVRSTATLRLTGSTSILFEALRYQLWTELLSPSGNWVRFNKFYGMCLTPPINDDGIVLRHPLTLADKTARLRRPLLEPITVAASTNPVTYVQASLTSVFGETAFDIPSTTVTTAAAKTFEADGTETYLSMYNALLEVCAFDQLTTNEDTGRYRSVSLADLAAKGPEATYGPGAGKIVTAGDVEPLLPQIPNRVRFVARKGPSLPSDGNGWREVTNQSTGPASVDRRGGEVVTQIVTVDSETQAQLDAIAASEAQRYFAGGGLRFTGKVGLNPLHSDRDVVELVKPRLGLSGTWLCTAWTYPMHPIQGEDDVLMAVTFEKRAA